MIKKGLLDFLKCFKYYLVPFGLLAIFTMFGLKIGVTSLSNAVKDFFTRAGEMANQAQIDFPAMWSAFVGEISKVNFSNDIGDAFRTIFSKEWLGNTLKVVAMNFFGDSLNWNDVGALLTETLAKIIMSFVYFGVMILIGLAAGLFLLTILIRRQLTKVKVGKLVLYSLADTAIWALLLVLLILLWRVAVWLGILILVIGIISLPFICLCEGYLFYGIKKIPFGQAAHIKNVLIIYLLEIIFLAITAAITAILMLIFKGFLGIMLALPIVEIGIIAVGLTAENYILNYLAKNQHQEIAEQQA